MAPEEPFISFERGIDREDPRTAIVKGGYDNASNIILWNLTQGGTHPVALKAEQKLDSLITWSSGNTIFFEPFTFNTYVKPTLTFLTHILMADDTGAAWRYDTGSPGTQTIVRRGFETTNKYWTPMVYDNWLLTFNGIDAPMKYGQHFLTSNVEARPFLFPLGSKPVTPCGAAIANETWTFTGGTSGFVNDASVPGGGSRVHTQSVKLDASGTAKNVFTAKNLNAGPDPYGGTPFGLTVDFVNFQVFKAAGGAANLLIDFQTTDGTDYFRFTQSVSSSASWQQFSLQLNSSATVGAPNWNNITSVKFTSSDGVNVVYVDDLYLLYGNAPPALQVATLHKTRVVGGGAPTNGSTVSALGTLFWSRAGFPDEYPAANNTPVPAGVHGLSKANKINALKEFSGSVVIGTPHALSSFTLDAAGNPVIGMITNEHGCDSHRGMVETPNGALVFPWQRDFFVIRSTWRSYGSHKIATLLSNMALSEPHPNFTIGVWDEATKTIRFWFREGSSPTATTNGVVLDYVRAQELGEGVWPSTMTQLADYVTPAYVSGARLVLYSRNNGPNIYQMEQLTTGSLTSSIELPWVSRVGSDKLVKWLGLIVPYASTNGVDVFIRYASHPDQFQTASYGTKIQTLPATPGFSEQARVLFGQVSRWCQVKFQTTTPAGMEIFPPIELIAVPTARVP
jgi:hypothetical protein